MSRRLLEQVLRLNVNILMSTMIGSLAAIGVPACLVSLYYLWIRSTRQTRVKNIHRKCVFITGCDTGFGNALARRLDAKGVPVFAGCLTEKGACDLKKDTSERLQTLLVDVGSHESIQDAYRLVKERLPNGSQLWGVVNNAGIPGQYGPLDFLDCESFQRVYNINLIGLVDVTTAFMPLINRSKGRIINTSSIMALLFSQDQYPYLASKAAVRAITHALRMERKQYGVKVSCIMPNFFSTPFAVFSSYEKRVRDNWETLPEEVRNHYGEEYVNTMIQHRMEATKSIATPDVTPVIDAYEHALFAQHPRDDYFPGIETVGFVLSNCPWFVTKYVIERRNRQRLSKVPRALKKKA